MDLRITIDLRGGCLEYPCAGALREAQHIDRAVDRGLGGLYGVVLVMDRARRAREVIDLVHLEVQGKRHVVTDELKPVVIKQVADVVLGASEEVVDADDLVALTQQPVTQVGAQKPGAAGHHNSGRHQITLFT